MDGWLLQDGVPLDELPDWARAQAPSESGRCVVLSDEGIASVTAEDGVVARWIDVIDVVVVEKKAYVLLPRKPPRLPWILVTRNVLSQEMVALGITSFAARVRERSTRAVGYRDAAVARPPEPIDELRARLLAGESVPGTIEVSLPQEGFAPSDHRRVLVLAPDGCVVATYDGVRAYRWQDIERFDRGTATPPWGGPPELALMIIGADGAITAVPERLYGLPIALVLALTESYRRRAVLR